MAATDEEKEKICVGKNNNSSNSAIKRTANDRRSPIPSDDIEHIPFSVLVQSFGCKRSRVNADFQSCGGSSTPSTAANDQHGLHPPTAAPLHGPTVHDAEMKGREPPDKDDLARRCIESFYNEHRDPVAELEDEISHSREKIDNSMATSQSAEDGVELRDGNEINGIDEDDDCDNVSEISGLSDLGMESRWNSSAGMIAWVHNQITQGTNPRVVLSSLVPDDTEIPEDLDDRTLWQLIVSIISEPPRRKKLEDVTTLASVVHLLRTCKNIIVLTGAGVSVSCGIPDFRSRDGIYARLAVHYPDLPDPQAMFDIQYFKKNPRPFFKFAKEIYPGQFSPSLSHRFIGQLESCKRLLRNYTQNIDTLESAAGITRVVQCHGSFADATCMVCKFKVDAEVIRDDIMNQVIPRCPRCSPEEELAILKPDIVFFGESLSEEFHQQIESDKDECDLLIVIGSSLKVRPVAIIPSIIAANVPQVLINREPLRHLNFDVELLGDCDVIINELCHLLGDDFKSLCVTKEPSMQLTREEIQLPNPVSNTQRPDGILPSDVPCLPKPEESNDESQIEDEKVDEGSKDHQGVSAGDDSEAVLDVDRCCAKNRSSLNNGPSSVKLSSYLKENSYLYRPPRQYVFRGAEVYEEDDSLSDSDCSSGSSDGAVDSPKDQSFECPQDGGLGELDGKTDIRDQVSSDDKMDDAVTE